MRYILFLISIYSSFYAIGQKRIVLNKVARDLEKENSEWHDGTATLKDVEGTKLQGLFQFNEKTQVLSFKTEDESEVLSPNRVMKFDFFDQEIQNYRTFVSIDYPINEDFKKEGKFLYYSLHEDTDVKTASLFFEVIRETRRFAVLVKLSPIHLVHGIEKSMLDPLTGQPTNNPLKQKTTRLTDLAQEVSVFFLEASGTMFLFSRSTLIETKDSTKKAKTGFLRSVDYNVNPDIDLGDKFLRKMMGDYFFRVKQYMDANKLRGNRDEDLIKIIDYYKQLEEQE